MPIIMKHALSSDPLDRVDAWIFDLDNTLYSPAADLFGQIDQRMAQYISELLSCDHVEARRVQKHYFHEHGTTLSGLMMHYGVKPSHFLDYVHDINLEVLDPAPDLARAIDALPGRKLIFTNGDSAYAQRVLDKLGLANSFEAIHDIHACAYEPKPMDSAYHSLIERLDLNPSSALFVEDMARNLRPAKALGMTTVWINNGSERGDHEADPGFIDYEITDLNDWLSAVHQKEM